MSEEAKKAKKGSYIGQAWLVIVLGLLYGAALAAVHTGLNDRIEMQKRNKIYRQLPIIVPGGTNQAVEDSVNGADGKVYPVYHVKNAEGGFAGWVVRAAGTGFADKIDLLVGLTPDLEHLTGVAVIEQKETPGLGDNIKNKWFGERFSGKTATKLEVSKREPVTDSQILAITGATVSSRAVTGIVNTVLSNCKEPLRQLADSGSGE